MIYDGKLDYPDWISDLENEVKLLDSFIAKLNRIIHSNDSTEFQRLEAKHKLRTYRLYKKQHLRIIAAMKEKTEVSE